MYDDLLIDTAMIKAISSNKSEVFDVFEAPFKLEQLKKAMSKMLIDFSQKIKELETRTEYSIELISVLLGNLVEKKVMTKEEAIEVFQESHNEINRNRDAE